MKITSFSAMPTPADGVTPSVFTSPIMIRYDTSLHVSESTIGAPSLMTAAVVFLRSRR